MHSIVNKRLVFFGGIVLVTCAFLVVKTFFGRTAPDVEYVGSYTWQKTEHFRYSEYSGLEITSDGTSFIALSDRAVIVRGSLERSGGVITGVIEPKFFRLYSDVGNYLDTLNSDTEGLTTAPNGGLYISLEGRNRVNYLAPDSWQVQSIKSNGAFDDLKPNAGLEAITLDQEGKVIVIPEQAPDEDGDFPVYRLDDDGWAVPYSLPRQGLFLPVGADTGPDGRLYLLERWYVPFIGFMSRVRSFAFGSDQLVDERLLFCSRLWKHDNLEGISVWRDLNGGIRLTMISDDNFNRLQKTEFVEYRLFPDARK